MSAAMRGEGIGGVGSRQFRKQVSRTDNSSDDYQESSDFCIFKLSTMELWQELELVGDPCSKALVTHTRGDGGRGGLEIRSEALSCATRIAEKKMGNFV